MAISAATIPPAFPVCSHHRFTRALTVDARSNQLLKPTAMHVYEVRPRKDHRGVDLISEALTFGPLWLQGTTCRPAIQSVNKFHTAKPRYAGLA